MILQLQCHLLGFFVNGSVYDMDTTDRPGVTALGDPDHRNQNQYFLYPIV